ncbi:MAG: phosphoribosylanthranilate isomerase [Dehalococcoidia bacterium]|nr:phosphoribosylanthranilate isomerase [Dehalococcoidia bacterium]
MVKVKICGITNLEDALAAVRSGADALGFVFAPSPRRMTPGAVREIVEKLPPLICKVGVFQDMDADSIKETLSYCHLDLAQLHGSEGPDACAALFPRVIKAFTVSTLPHTEDLSSYRVAAYMLDREKGRRHTRASEDVWRAVRSLRDHGLLILAGGLTPGNVSEAVKIARPYAVDVSSGVESRPGRKDHARLRAFIISARRGSNGINLENA